MLSVLSPYTVCYSTSLYSENKKVLLMDQKPPKIKAFCQYLTDINILKRYRDVI